jgi:hypothetical protein
MSRIERSCRVGVAMIAMVVAAGWVSPTRVGGSRLDGPQVRYLIDATKPDTVCAGSDVDIKVTLLQQVSGISPDTPVLVNRGLLAELAAVGVSAAIANPEVIETSETLQITGFNGSIPPTATFTFHAKKAGVSTVTFTGRLADLADFGKQNKVIDRTVTVINCKFDVSMFAQFRSPSKFGLLSLDGITKNVTLTPVNELGDMRELAQVTWTYFSTKENCSASVKLDSKTTDVAIYGTLDQAGNLTLQFKYDPVPARYDEECGGVKGGYTEQLQPADVSVTVPFSGGSDTIPQNFAGIDGGPGNLSYLVLPLEEGD